MTDKTPSFSLTGGIDIPCVGFGTYMISDETAADTVSTAIKTGYRHIDTAEGYGNETGVGAGIRSGLRETGLSRNDIFVTTKLWPGNEAWGQEPKTKQGTIASLDASLQRLGLEHVDLYLIHAPFKPEQRLAQWEGLIESQKQGKARAIGVSNFTEVHIDALTKAGLPLPSANQIELHPWSQKPDLVSWLFARDIRPIAYSSLVPLSTWRAKAGQDSAKTEQMKADSEGANSPFRKLAAKYGVSEARLLLRWGVQNGYPVLPKSTDTGRMRQNLDIFSFAIDEEDMAAIATMDRGGGVAWAGGDPTTFG